MKLPVLQRLVVEDFPEQKKWIGPMFNVINRFITVAVQALNGGIIFEANITGQEQVFDFVYSSATASFPKRMNWKLAEKPRALSVVEAYAQTSSTTRTPVIIVAAWEFADDGTVSISSFVQISTSGAAALTVGTRYTIRVRVTP